MQLGLEIKILQNSDIKKIVKQVEVNSVVFNDLKILKNNLKTEKIINEDNKFIINSKTVNNLNGLKKMIIKN